MQTLEELIKTKPIKDPHQRVLLNIVYTGSWLVNKMNQALKPFELTEPQYNVMRILRGQNGSCMNLFEIQNRMVQRMSNVSRLIDKLLDKGLVERNECKSNRRMVEIQITQKGLTLLEDIEPALQKMIKKSFDNLTKEEAKLMSEWLDKFRNE